MTLLCFDNYRERISQRAQQLGAPLPSKPEAERSWALFQELTKIIGKSSAQELEFSDWLEHVLYQGSLGYYAAQSSIIGATGDFITAPEISNIFAMAIANWLAPVLPDVEGRIVEFGAGNGTLAVQLLQQLEQQVEHYWIVEVSESLQQLQREKLTAAGLIDKVQWINSPLEMPGSAVLLGNEVLDAIPAHRFRYCDGKFFEAKVRQNELEFEVVWQESLSPMLQQWLQQHSDKLDWQVYSNDFIFEVAPKRSDWLNQWLSQLTTGYCLFLDYGYPAGEFFSPERYQGSYQAFYRHRRHQNFCWLPGLQDVTSHVNFSEVCAALEPKQWQLSGFCTQSELILAAGVLERVELPDDLSARVELSQALQRLMMPGEMGETVKAIAFSHNIRENARSLIPMQLAMRL